MLAYDQQKWWEKDVDANGVHDYWTQDVAGFCLEGWFRADWWDEDWLEGYGEMPNVDPSFARVAIPRNGYLFVAMTSDHLGRAYRRDADGDGRAYTNQWNFGYCAYPQKYGEKTKYTYIVDASGVVYRKDLAPKSDRLLPVQLQWPAADPTEAGWEAVE